MDAPAPEIAAALRREAREEVGLPLSVGVARTKVLAKIASRSAKPDGLFVVPVERELEFLHPLPVERIWGVGPATAGRLNANGLRTVGQAAELSEADLMAILGKAAGRYVHAVANNREFPAWAPPRAPLVRRAARPRQAPAHARRSRCGPRGPRGPRDEPHAAQAPRRPHGDPAPALRRLHARDALVLPPPRHDDAEPIAAAALDLLEAAMPVVEQRGITLVGITVTNLERGRDHSSSCSRRRRTRISA